MSNKSKLFIYDKELASDAVITNGDFNGNLNGWTVTPSANWTYDSGRASAKLGNTGTISQSVSGLVIGKEYTIKFFMSHPSTVRTDGGSLSVTINGATTVYSNAGWKEITFIYTTSDTLTLSQDSDFNGIIDKISIELTTNSRTNYTNTYREIFLSDDEFVNLNFAVADVATINSRNSSYSQSITIPATAENNLVFEHLYNIDIEDTNLYLNKKNGALLYYGDALIIDGILELTSVNRNDFNNVVSYTVIVRSNVKTFSDEISDKFITGNNDFTKDIDFSEYDHVFTTLNIRNTWRDGDTPAWPALPTEKYGSGYYYPIIDYTNIESNVSLNYEDFRPAIYVKELFDKIIADTDFTYSSTFINSEYFKKLILPFVGEIKTSDDEIEERKFRAGLKDDIINQYYLNRFLAHGRSSNAGDDSKIFPINDDIEPPLLDFFDNGGNFFTGGNYYRVPSKGIYKFHFNTNDAIPYLYDNTQLAAAFYNPVGPNDDIGPRMELTVRVLRKRNNVFSILKSKNHIIKLPNYFYNGKIWINGVGFRKTALPPQSFDVVSDEEELEYGDLIYIQVALNNKLSAWQDTLGRAVGSGQFVGTVDFKRLNPNDTARPATVFYVEPIKSSGLLIGEQVNINDTLPRGIKQIDFINSLIKMFNLIIDVDKVDSNKLIIEPREQYLSSGNTIDWTSKLDTTQDITIERIPTLIDKNIRFTYEEDDDYYNDDYKTKYTETFGDYEILNIDKTKDETLIDIIFSPTPSKVLPGTDYIIPQIWQEESNGDIVVKPYNIRILHRLDIYDNSSQPFSLVKTESAMTYIGIDTNDTVDAPSSNWVFHMCPTAGHIEDPYDGTSKDLNWGYSKEYYAPLYPDNLPQWGNLYNTYWRNYIETIIDVNSKKVTAYFKLSEIDIYNFNFNDKIIVDGQFFLVNKIIDWNPNVITEVELIKLKENSLPTSDNEKRDDTTITLDYNNVEYKSAAVPLKSRSVSKTQKLKVSNKSFITSYTNTENTEELPDWPLTTGQTTTTFSGQTVEGVTGVTRSEPTSVTNVSRGFGSGNNNVIDSKNFILAGRGNVFTGPNINSLTIGNTNEIGNNTQNITIIGNDNKVDSNISNVQILGGENINLQKSNTTVLGNQTILTNKPIESIIHVISAPNLDGKVINPFNTQKLVHVMSGGNMIDGVRPLRSVNTIFVVDSTTKTTYDYINVGDSIVRDANGNIIS